jgi:hypothetical protein
VVIRSVIASSVTPDLLKHHICTNTVGRHTDSEGLIHVQFPITDLLSSELLPDNLNKVTHSCFFFT